MYCLGDFGVATGNLGVAKLGTDTYQGEHSGRNHWGFVGWFARHQCRCARGRRFREQCALLLVSTGNRYKVRMCLCGDRDDGSGWVGLVKWRRAGGCRHRRECDCSGLAPGFCGVATEFLSDILRKPSANQSRKVRIFLPLPTKVSTPEKDNQNR